jgi:nucleoside-diphosphate-sugar epimerase
LELPKARWEAELQPMCSHVNVGTGDDIAIADLAGLIARKTGFCGTVQFDPTKPDGTPRKLLDVSRFKALGWQSQISLEDGLSDTLDWYKEHASTARGQEV